jgi:hypothetical protein
VLVPTFSLDPHYVAILLTIAGVRLETCSGCGEKIFFVRDKAGITVMDVNLRAHKERCGERWSISNLFSTDGLKKING